MEISAPVLDREAETFTARTSSSAVLEKPREEIDEAKPQTTPLPESANEGKIYSARFGKAREFSSFQDKLDKKLAGTKDTPQVETNAKRLFAEIDKKVNPQILEALREIKRLGIRDDLLLPPELKMLAYAIKTDQWGERQKLDYPNIDDENYIADPDNPLHRVSIDNGKVTLSHLNPGKSLYTDRLLPQLQKLYEAVDGIYAQMPVDKFIPGWDQMPPEQRDQALSLRGWVENQAVSRRVLIEKGTLQPSPVNLAEAMYSKNLGEEVAQASNPVELWKTSDGRTVVVKEAPYQTLQAEVLENKFMRAMGLPVPETYTQILTPESVQARVGELRRTGMNDQAIERHLGIIQKHVLESGKPTPLLVVGFLEGYKEEELPFELSEKYHTNETIQRGLILDLWLNQYNRRAHNLMMKDGKIAFIDNGAALFCRATGGFKEFSGDITTENLWDILRTIPDSAKKTGDYTDEPVNDAYAQVMTVQGGSKGELIINPDKAAFLRGQLQRLSKVTDEQIAEYVEDVGFKDDQASIDLVKSWLEHPKIKDRLTELRALKTRSEDEGNPKLFTPQDERDLRWTQGAERQLRGLVVNYEALQAAAKERGLVGITPPGLKTFMIDVLKSRRESLIEVLGPQVGFEKPAPPPPTPELTSPEQEQLALRRAVSERFWAAMDIITAHNESGNYNIKAALELLMRSLTDPNSIPDQGYNPKLNPDSLARLKRPLEGFPKSGKLLESDAIQIRKDLLLELLRINPPLNPGSVDTLADIASRYDLRIWTLGDVGDQEHNLPPGTLTTPRLEGSEHQIHKLDNSKVVEQVREAVREKTGSDEHVSASITSDKFAQLPYLVDQLAARGNDHIIIFDDSFSSLEKAKKALESLPPDLRPSYTLVLINQGRKRTDTPKSLDTTGTSGEYRVLTSSSKEVNDAILKAPQLVDQIQALGKKPAVLMDFDGVISDNAAYRKLQEEVLYSTISPHLI